MTNKRDKDNQCSSTKEREHSHGFYQVFGKRTEIIFSLLSGAFLLAGFLVGLGSEEGMNILSLGLYLAAYFFGGFYTIIEAFEHLRKGDFEIDSLMIIAAIGAAILGHWAEGALLLFLFSLGHALEHYAMNKARKSISDLGKITPKTAFKLNGKAVEEVPVEYLNIDDLILVKPNSTIPVDGMVVKGVGPVNQAPITGESVPVNKSPSKATYRGVIEFSKLKNEHQVFAGTLNGSAALHIRVLKKSHDTTLARMVQLVAEAESQKSPTQLFTDRFQRIYVPAVLILVVLLHFAFLILDEPFRDSFYRAMAVLVASSPCALAISTPSAVLSGVARAARSGVLIKGGGPLEVLGKIHTIAFDKTGTITYGNPVMTDRFALDSEKERYFLEVLGATEQLSDHPLAAAMVRSIEDQGIDIPKGQAANLKSMVGKGIRAQFDGKRVLIGNKEMFDQEGIFIPPRLLEIMEQYLSEGKSIAVLHLDDEFLGVAALRDEPKENTREVLNRLRDLGIDNFIMLTGDHQKVGDSIAAMVGIETVKGNLLPEDKVAAVVELMEQYEQVAMIGDGVNDAPAMAKSSVAIGMGVAGSDVALEAADVALMKDDLAGLPFVISLSRKSHQIIKQNLWISMGMVAILIPLTLMGIADIGPAVVAHEGSTLVVVFNALRLLGFRE